MRLKKRLEGPSTKTPNQKEKIQSSKKEVLAQRNHRGSNRAVVSLIIKGLSWSGVGKMERERDDVDGHSRTKFQNVTFSRKSSFSP